MSLLGKESGINHHVTNFTMYQTLGDDALDGPVRNKAEM